MTLHNFPSFIWIYCNQAHTQQEAELFVELANKVGLPIDEETLDNLCDVNYPYFYWNGNIICQHCKVDLSKTTNVSLADFFKLLNITINVSQMRELFSTI